MGSEQRGSGGPPVTVVDVALAGAGPDEAPSPGPRDRPPRSRRGGGGGGHDESSERLAAVFLPALLLGAIVAVLLPAVLVGVTSGVVLLKLSVAALLSFLPGWLYLQFIKNKGQSIYDEYVLNLFRLHIDEYRNLPAPPQHTSYYRPWEEQHATLGVETKDNLYRKKFEAVYGKSSVSTFELIYDRRTVRAHSETFGPVLFATVLLCLGWVLVLQPEPWRELNVLGALDLSGRPPLPNEVLRFGFLGAYAFILQDILRRYFRDDLKTSAYISAVARVVFVTVVLSAAQFVSPLGSEGLENSAGLENVFAFMVGFFPQIGLQAMQAALAKPLRRLIPTLKVRHPLSELDGLNIWYEARLAEEGVEDMQNLVSANLVDLMLHSRVPIARLIDWIDQAFLALHLPMARDLALPDDSPETPRAQLRRLGIRTASDLERAWAALRNDAGFRARVSAALRLPPDEGAAAVRSVLAALEGDVNFWHVREFKRHGWLLEDTRRAVRRGRAPAATGTGAVSQPPAPRLPEAPLAPAGGTTGTEVRVPVTEAQPLVPGATVVASGR